MGTVDIAWFAGLFEGEGSIHIEASKLVPRLRIDSTDKDIVIRAANVTGGTAYPCRPASRNYNLVKQPKNPKSVYRFVLNGQRAMEWLMTIYVLLGKRRQKRAREALSYWTSRQRRLNGWNAHRAKYGCKCQAHTGACHPKKVIP